MSATLKIYQALQVLLNNDPKQAGSRKSPAEVSIEGLAYDVTKTVKNEDGDNYNIQSLWQSGDGGLGDFDLLWFESDEDVLLELRNDNATDQFAVIEVKAGVPVVLGGSGLIGDDSGSSPLTDGSADTLDTIDQIRVKNNQDGSSTTVTATVRLMLFN